jgi:hypothetical protein
LHFDFPDDDPARVKRFAEVFRCMRAEGIQLPATWATNERGNHAYLSSRYNAGYIKNCLYEAGPRIVLSLDVPSGGQRQIADAQLNLADRWVDGRGRTWQDIILGVSLTPQPVRLSSARPQLKTQRRAVSVPTVPLAPAQQRAVERMLGRGIARAPAPPATPRTKAAMRMMSTLRGAKPVKASYTPLTKGAAAAVDRMFWLSRTARQ